MWHSALANHRWQITAQLLLRIKVTRNSLLSLTTNVMCYLVPLVITRDQRRCWRREICLMNVQRNSILQFVWFSSSCSLLTILFGMATESPSEHEEIRVLDQETPRSSAAESGDSDLVRKLLAEVSEMRKENQQLRTEVANLKTTATRKKLFESSKDNDPECSVSNIMSVPILNLSWILFGNVTWIRSQLIRIAPYKTVTCISVSFLIQRRTFFELFSCLLQGIHLKQIHSLCISHHWSIWTHVPYLKSAPCVSDHREPTQSVCVTIKAMANSNSCSDKWQNAKSL